MKVWEVTSSPQTLKWSLSQQPAQHNSPPGSIREGEPAPPQPQQCSEGENKNGNSNHQRKKVETVQKAHTFNNLSRNEKACYRQWKTSCLHRHQIRHPQQRTGFSGTLIFWLANYIYMIFPFIFLETVALIKTNKPCSAGFSSLPPMNSHCILFIILRVFIKFCPRVGVDLYTSLIPTGSKDFFIHFLS